MTAAEPAPVPSEPVAAIRARYEAGHSMRAVAAYFGVSYSVVRAALRESGVVPRGVSVRRLVPPEADDAAAFDELVRQGVVLPPKRPSRRPVPVPIPGTPGLSDIVIADRR